MHEASLVQGLLNLVTEALEKNNSADKGRKAGKVRQIKCSYGLLSCFETATLRACFEIFSEKTVCEGAQLILELTPLPCRCKSCGERFNLQKRNFVCPVCESNDISFSGGNGLVLEAIEVEEEKADDRTYSH